MDRLDKLTKLAKEKFTRWAADLRDMVADFRRAGNEKAAGEAEGYAEILEYIVAGDVPAAIRRAGQPPAGAPRYVSLTSIAFRDALRWADYSGYWIDVIGMMAEVKYGLRMRWVNWCR